MSVYFVYRSHYEGPSAKHVRVFDSDSVLGWFQAVWERARQAPDAHRWVKAELGTSVYGGVHHLIRILIRSYFGVSGCVGFV
jgi:hypothetical protein